jgi:hypothetical protein
MTLRQPTTIRRFRHFPTADSLASFLRESGINAHLAPPSHAEEDELYVLYDVCVVGCTNDEIQRLLNEWATHRKLSAASTDLFCYHCGESLESPLATCPSCGGSLEVPAGDTTQAGG